MLLSVLAILLFFTLTPQVRLCRLKCPGDRRGGGRGRREGREGQCTGRQEGKQLAATHSSTRKEHSSTAVERSNWQETPSPPLLLLHSLLLLLHSAACTAQIVSHHCTVKQGSTTMDCAMVDFGVFSKYIQPPFVLA